MSFEISKSIIRNIEKEISKNYGSQIINQIEDSDTPLKKPAEKVNNGFFYPLRLMLLGYEIWSKDFKKFSILVVIVTVLLSFFMNDIKIAFSSDTINYIFLFIVSIIAFISTYSSPSSYCSYKIRKEYFDAVVTILKKNKVDKSYQINLIQKNIDILEMRAKTRVRSIKAFIAVASAFLIFFGKKYFDEIINSKMSFELFTEFLTPYLILITVYMITEWYSKAITLIFHTAKIGCNEYQYDNDKFNE